jgi:adenylate kinase
VFDGVVRTIPQAEGTEKLLAERGRRIQHVLFLDVSDDEILSRIAKRRTQETRADDAPEAVARRLSAYRAQTAPVLSWYESRGGVHRIAGSGTVEDISNRIRESLGR